MSLSVCKCLYWIFDSVDFYVPTCSAVLVLTIVGVSYQNFVVHTQMVVSCSLHLLHINCNEKKIIFTL